MQKAPILFIDDESINLDLFERAFGKEFQVHLARNGEGALALLDRKGEMAVVLSDQRMPGLSGVDVLNRIEKLFPDTVRMVVTAYTGTEDLMNAINTGHVYRYVLKPWDEDDLRVAIANAVEKYQLTKEKNRLLAALEEKNRILDQANTELEQQVAARTAELLQANSVLVKLNEQLFASNLTVEAQARELEEVNKVLSAKIEALEQAAEKVKVLGGLLPICSYCRRIRDDRSYWRELEAYVQENADMEFTHSICPDCYERRVKPELTDLLEKRGKSPKKAP